jgi:uncharacterized membrane protein
VLAGKTVVKHPDAEGIAIAGSKVFTTAEDYSFLPVVGQIQAQFGDYLIFDISSPASPNYQGDLFPTQPDSNGFTFGGPNWIFGFAQLDDHTALLTSTTSTGSNVNVGVGNLITVDSTNPSSPMKTSQVQVPEARLINSIAVQGNLALVTGDTKGRPNGLGGFTGNLTLTLFDITNPASPKVLQTLVTSLNDSGGAQVVSLGGFIFAAGGATNNGQNVLLLIDATQFDPANPVPNPTLRYIPYNVSNPIFPSVSNGTTFYATTPSGLSIYQLGQVIGPQVNVTLQVPVGTGVTASNFNPAPTQTLTGTSQTTYVWQQPASNTITFNESVTGMRPGVPATIVTTGLVEFVEPSLGNLTIGLGPLVITPAHFLSISPALQNVTAGKSTSFTVTVQNPTAASATYSLSVQGLPPNWANLQPNVSVPANGSTDVILTVTPDLASMFPNFSFPAFTVVAMGSNGLNGSVTADLYVNVDTGDLRPLDPNVGAQRTLVLSANPNPITIGQGQTVPVTALLTNAGNVVLKPGLTFAAATTHIAASAAAATLNLGAGLSQSVPFTLTSDTSTPVGATTASVTAIDGINNINQKLSIPVNVVANGVKAAITGQGTPGSPYVLTVTNSGSVQDTYTLTPSGVFASITTLGANSVTLTPGQSRNISIALAGFAGLAPGAPLLQITATSQGVAAVFATASLAINIGSNLGVTAAINPNPAQASNGSAALFVQVTNTGNVDDTYTATISGTTGGVTATLNMPNLPPAQTVSAFRTGALGGAQIPMTGTLANGAPGTITVTITSLTNPAVTTTAKVTITGSTNQPTLVSSPTSLTFSGPAGSPITTPQNITITSTGTALDFTLITDQPWLHASPASGNTSATNMIAVTVDTTGLASSVNGYVGHVKFTSAGAGNSPLLIPVTLMLSPTLTLSRNFLNYGYSGNLITSPQPILVIFKGGGVGVNWSVTSNQSNITASPTSGTGNGQFVIVVTPGPGGTVTVTSAGTAGSPQQVQVNVKSVTPGLPFGSFDTPIDKTTGIVGAIPVTGWALDNIEVTKVDIWREPVNGEPAQSNGLVYIGDAVFVIGARTDVESLYSTMPWHFRGGWGYQMLTNYLPNSAGGGLGNGTYKIHAIAHDASGNSVDLGTRTITIDNAHANKPFGTIDTPSQGGTATGNSYVNFGWALTPNPAFIPQDGSTLTVQLDGVAVGAPTYNNFRSDIASLFPGYANSGGAVGFFRIDTTQIPNGVHTIAWVAYDNLGHGEGLGSRYYNILNTGTGGTATPDDEPIETVAGVKLRKGHDLNREPDALAPDENGAYIIEAEELDRIELHAGVNGSQQTLPPGSTLKGGVFYWQLGAGLLGEYDLLLTRPNGEKVRVLVRVRPKRFSESSH